MSKENAIEFFETLVFQEDLQEKLRKLEAGTERQRLEGILKLGLKFGLEFSVEDLRAALSEKSLFSDGEDFGNRKNFKEKGGTPGFLNPMYSF